MGSSDQSALRRPGCIGSCLSGRAWLLPLLFRVFLDCLGRGATSEDAEVYAAEVRTREVGGGGHGASHARSGGLQVGETHRALGVKADPDWRTWTEKQDWHAATPWLELCNAPLPKALRAQDSQPLCTLKLLGTLTYPSLSPCSLSLSP